MLDVSMPAMNGWQLLQSLRDNHYHQPIIMVSADASEGKDSETPDPDAAPLHNAYVIKPVRISLLLDHIGRLLNLVWCYEQTATPDAPALDVTHEKNTLIIASDKTCALSDKDLDELARLAAIGHKKGLVEKIQQLQNSGIYPVAATELLQQLANHSINFQFEKVLELIDDYTTTIEPY